MGGNVNRIMSRIAQVKNNLTQFSDIQAPSLLLLSLELRFIWEALAGLSTYKTLQAIVPNKGNNRPVLLIPGLGATDVSTALLRKFLDSLGYVTYPWAQGRNCGLNEGDRILLQKKLKQIHHKHDCKVSIIGHSLGGIYARELASSLPTLVKQVITLGTPFTGHPLATSATVLYEWLSGERIEDIDYEKVSELQKKPPVPTTSIYSKYDGVVAWQCSIEKEEQSENINLRGHSHIGMTSAPLALYLIANRLAEPDSWRPFAPTPSEQLFFGVNDH